MPTPARPPVRKRDASATRLRLLSTAELVFVEKGFEGTRVDEIAARAAVNKRMIYVYFGDKERLYREVLRVNFQRMLDATRELASDHSDPVQQAEAAIRRYFGFCADHPPFVRLLSWESLNGGKRIGEVMATPVAAGIEALHDILQRGVDTGAFRPDLDVRKVAFSAHALCISYFSRRELLEAMWGQDITAEPARGQVLEHILATVMRGIRSSSGGGAPRATKPKRTRGGQRPGGSNP